MSVPLALGALGCTDGSDVPAGTPAVLVRDSAGVPFFPLDDFPICERCSLELVLDTKLGERDGPGAVDADFPSIRFDPVTRLYAAVWGA